MGGNQVPKACVTNLTAAGRFLVAGGFTGLPLIFHIVRVQFKISLEEMHHIYRRLGADRPPLWRSPAWELQVVRRQLCTSTVISDVGTASAFFNDHWPVPGCSQLPLYMQQHGHRTSHRPILQSSSAKKEVVRHCDFSVKFGILENHHGTVLGFSALYSFDIFFGFPTFSARVPLKRLD
jgi:hypothetical protein